MERRISTLNYHVVQKEGETSPTLKKSAAEGEKYFNQKNSCVTPGIEPGASASVGDHSILMPPPLTYILGS